MPIDVTIMIGGEAGQGIQTVGDLLAQACHRAGLYLMAVNDFESRIRGGHSFMQLRISDKPIHAPSHEVHLLVALNEETYSIHRHEIAENGIAIIDRDQEGREGNLLSVPITQLAKDAGSKIVSNTVAAGAALTLLGGSLDRLQDVLEMRFGDKKASVLEMNQKAAKSGMTVAENVDFKWAFDWPSSEPKGHLISGARALALGALAADCRFAAFYPMSPATGVMVNLTEFEERLPILVEQAEDEIAAVNMVIGGAFAGVRSLTATSGGGFALMSEGLGLAGMTETPLVVINAQRPGPATGLPTRTAQADLRLVLHAGQDEFPRFVLAPKNVDDAFEIMIRAFHLADKYQVPVIVLVDQYFADSLTITEKSMQVPDRIERFIVGDDDLDNPAEYKRFALTEDGVSPRALPCAGNALVMVTGNEHQTDGHLSERISDRNEQVDKRHRKLSGMATEICPPEAYYGQSELLLVGWGATAGIIRESVDRLRGEGIDAGALLFSDIWPFPEAETVSALAQCKRFCMVEQNVSAQLGWLIRERTGLKFERAVLKYDGRPLVPNDIVEAIKGGKE